MSEKEIHVVFVDSKTKKSYDALKTSSTEDKRLALWLDRAFDDIKKDYTCGIFIPKKTHS